VARLKRALITILILFLIVVLLAGSCWFFLVFRHDDTTAFVLDRGAANVRSGNYKRAIQYYTLADRLSPHNSSTLIALSDTYIASGNYTRAEYTLVSAISANPEDPDLYAALSRVYVQQGKLLDAEQMLTRISNEAMAEKLDSMRPEPPEFSAPSGVYNTNLELSLILPEGVSAFWNLDGDYPSQHDLYDGPAVLPDGDTSATALTVSSDGLVSRAVTASFTVGRVVRDVEFTDPAMESWARYILELDDDEPILTDDLWTIQALYLPEDVKSLEDLAYFEDLSVLSVQNLQGVDFSPLSNLHQLKYLNLDGCAVGSGDLQVIGSLSTLTELHLAGCGLSNISALEGLTKLQVLDLTGNSIVSIDPLKNMTQMRELRLSSNAISAIAPLAGMTELEILDLNYNTLISDAVISRMRNLKELYLASCGVEDLDFLMIMPSLQRLNVSGNQLSDISILSGCTELTWLDIANNEITTLEPIANLVLLTELYADYNQIEELPMFNEACALHRLTVSYNQLTDAAGVVLLPQLNYLNVDYNQLRDISDLANCIGLIEVHAFGNPIRDVQALLDVSIIVNYDPTYAIDEPEEENPEGSETPES